MVVRGWSNARPSPSASEGEQPPLAWRSGSDLRHPQHTNPGSNGLPRLACRGSTRTV